MFSRRNIDREESRMTATGSSYDLGETTEGRLSHTGSLPERTAQGAADMGDMAARRVAEIKDVTAEKASAVGARLGEAAREVELEQFLLRGNVSGHPFRIELEDEAGGERYLAFEFNLKTDDGDTIRFTGRKRIAGSAGALEGRVEAEDDVSTTEPETTSSMPGSAGVP